MMNLHLAEISTQVVPGAICVLLCDGAGWHQPGERLIIPENIVLLPLPTYSPELNAMENVWAICGKTNFAQPSGRHMSRS